MGLSSALAKLQKNGMDLYVQMSQFFGENSVVRAGWIEMARDLEQQAAALKILPGSFWTHLKPDEATLKAALELCSSENVRSSGDRSLSGCFAAALGFEEPLILKTYVPLIRVLRTESLTERGLDFYILVKAHVARLTRLIEPYSADPALVQRVHDLLETFEREVQRPPVPVGAHQVKGAAKRSKRPRHEPSTRIHVRTAQRPQKVARPKRLVKKLGLSRRQAQR
jgi:hypothetical protein